MSMNMQNDKLNEQGTMISLGYDKFLPQNLGRGLTYQGAYMGSYWTQLYIRDPQWCLCCFPLARANKEVSTTSKTNQKRITN